MAEGLEGEDAARYAAGFVHGKSLGLDDDYAAAFASGFLLFSIISPDVLLGRGILKDFDEYVRTSYVEPFEEALAGGASPVEALGLADEAFRVTGGWWPLATLRGRPYEGMLAEDYAKAFAQTSEVGLAAHQYAAFYAGNKYQGMSDEHAYDAGSVIAREYRESTQRDGQLRIKYASAYLLGYQIARLNDYENPNTVDWWATAYAEGYVLGWLRATNNRWKDATDLSFDFAYVYALAKVDWGYTNQESFLQADAYYRGAYHASQLDLSRGEIYDYAREYYGAYHDRISHLRWNEERSHVYATAFAEAKLDDSSEEDAEDYARGYERAYSEAKSDGQSEEEAHEAASAAIDAEAAG